MMERHGACAAILILPALARRQKMNDTTHDLRGKQLDEVARLVAAKVAPEQRATLQAFVARYFGQVDPEDLSERQPADLYGAALSHWNFARKRDKGRPRVRVFNPTIVEHGWESTHTIVEIVNDDMPFLVDSVGMEVNRHGLTLHLIMHPILAVERASDGTLAGLASDSSPDSSSRGALESFIHVEVDRIVDPAQMESLSADLVRVLDDVRAAVGDWQPLVARVRAIADEVRQSPPPLPAEELSEGLAFLDWIADNHFTDRKSTRLNSSHRL